jgi:nickel/cobalt transporter (NicO) family protein
VGIVSTLAMSAGVALTICAIGLTSRGVNRVGVRSARIERVRRGIALCGACFIVVFAAWQVFALVVGIRAMALV